MPEYYFNKIPTIEYNDTKCRNITKRPILAQNVVSVPIQFYPWEVDSGLRADVIADAYYGDSYLDWMIYLVNGILDPYTDWYLSENDFENLIIKKYDSVEESLRRIRHYELNWSEDDVNISPTHYQETLAEALKKYYSPVFGQKNTVIAYRRRKEEWIANTNKIQTIEISLNANTEFSNGELINIKDGGQFVGRAEVLYANTTMLYVKNVSGNTTSNTALVLGLTTEANADLVETNTLDTTIPDEEFVYWTPVTYFEWERARNEKNKNIWLLDAGRALDVSEDIRVSMKVPVDVNNLLL